MSVLVCVFSYMYLQSLENGNRFSNEDLATILNSPDDILIQKRNLVQLISFTRGCPKRIDRYNRTLPF